MTFIGGQAVVEGLTIRNSVGAGLHVGGERNKLRQVTINTSGAGAVVLEGTDNVLEGLDGSTAATYGVLISNALRCRLLRANVRGVTAATQDVIKIDTTRGAVTGCVLEDVYTTNGAQYGISVATGVSRTRIRLARIEGAASHGLYDVGTETEARDVRSLGVGANGIYLGGTGFLLDGFRVTGPGSNGVRAVSATRGRIRNGQVTTAVAARNAFELYGCSGTRIESCTVVSSAQDGATLTSSAASCVVQNVTVVAAGRYGIFDDTTSTRTAIKGCAATGTTNGIRTTGTGARVLDNTASWFSDAGTGTVTRTP